MTVYGFNDRETAVKLKKMVAAGSVMGAAIGENVFDESGGFAFINKTEKQIPPFAILFGGEFEQNEGKTKDYVGRSAYAWSQVKNEDDEENKAKKENWFFNNSMPVDPDEWGWSQAKGDVQLARCNSGSDSIELGKRISVHDREDFEVLPTEESSYAAIPIGWSAKAVGIFDGEEYGVQDGTKILAFQEKSVGDAVVIVGGRVVEWIQDSGGFFGFGGVTLQIETASNGEKIGDTVNCLGITPYPLHVGSVVFAIESPEVISTPLNPNVGYEYALLSYGITELPYPEGDENPTPG